MEGHPKNQGNLQPPGALPRFLVLGLGRSGMALSEYFARRGTAFWICDDRGEAALQPVLDRFPAGCFWCESPESWNSLQTVFASPGVPLSHPILVSARERGIPIESELDLAFVQFGEEEARRRARGEAERLFFGITGTNGKSTTVALLAHFLNAAGISAVPCGNFGRPLLDVLEGDDAYRAYGVEVSSFQAETSPHFVPHYAALLNLTPDHLDRYPTIDAYWAAKEQMIARQGPDDFLVYNAEEPRFIACARRAKARAIPFSSAKALPEGAFVNGSQVVLRLAGSESRFSLAGNPLIGLHHLENILAASLLARLAGVDEAVIEGSLPNFRGLPHRVERVGMCDGVVFYDDSKATNVGALEMSLASFDKPVVLIAGGRDKGSDFRPLSALVRGKVRAVYLIGEAAEKIADAWRGVVPVELAETMERAVLAAHALAKRAGDPVLLAPACASFDQFRDYHHRGETFQRLVRDLIEKDAA